MAGENIRNILKGRYGRAPELTEGEKKLYSSLVESGEIDHYQEAANIWNLAESAQTSGDSQTAQAALARYEQLTGKKLGSVEELLDEIPDYSP